MFESHEIGRILEEKGHKPMGDARKVEMEEKTVKEEELFRGKIVTLKKLEVQLPDGQAGMREVVEHPGAVAVLPVCADGRLIFVMQYRKAVEDCLLEIPAGKLEPGETPEACATRELEEEVGCTAGKLSLLSQFYTSPGFTNEKVYLFLAENLKEGEKHLDQDEFLEAFCLTPQEAFDKVKNGIIQDAKTIVALQAWQLRLFQPSHL